MEILRSMALRYAMAGGVGIAALTGCDSYNNDRGLGDAPVGTQDESPRKVWNNVDTFPNIVAFCIGENGVYTTTREAAPTVVADDPNCDEGGILRT